MFERFGEFASWQDLNEAAAGQKEEGDESALLALARENGIEDEDVEDYLDGLIPELVTPLSAAMGRVTVWEKEYKDDLNIRIALNVLRSMLGDPRVQEAVVCDGRNPKDFMEKLKAHAKKHQKNGCGTACATDRDKERALLVYFTGGDLDKELEDQRKRLLA